MRFTKLSLALMGLMATQAALAVDIDGKIAPGEWEGATHVTDFKQVQPETLASSKYRTEAWYMPTPKGMVVAFRNYQPQETRRRMKARRDEGGQDDRNNVFIDFDGNGVQGYKFTVSISGNVTDGIITNENSFNEDWDSDIRYAASESAEYWETEILIPWHVATMAAGKDGKRTIGIYLDRVFGGTNERFAAPGVTFQRTPFLSNFTKVEVPAYSQSLVAVTPYVTAMHDMVGKKNQFKAGADVYWKPNGQFQLSATVNPDFGQVESDGIVINFSANETFYGDKRPFFTENQGVFDFGLLNDNSQLFYTRRVGGASDDGNGLAEIDAAAKINGSLGKLSYGVFAANERGDGGSSFQAGRLMYALPTQTFGAMVTHVDRPFLDRSAWVYGLDHKWKPNNQVSVNSNVVMSDIDTAGLSNTGYAATSYLTWNPDKHWNYQLLGMYFDRKFDPNDMGYLNRNNMKYGHLQIRYTWSDLPKSWWVSNNTLSGRIYDVQNLDGRRLNGGLRVQNFGGFRDGGDYYMQYEHQVERFDDRMTRGRNSLRYPARDTIDVEASSGRHGKWRANVGIFAAGSGLYGNDEIYTSRWVGATYFHNDQISWSFSVSSEDDPDALIWNSGNTVDRFRLRTAVLASTLKWDMTAKSDLRVKLEAVGLHARGFESVNVLPNGDYTVLAGLPQDFRLNQMGFQLRYRYELAPLSNLYVVYGRGGFSQDHDSRGDDWSMLRDSRSLRNDEQIMVKLSYRFSN